MYDEKNTTYRVNTQKYFLIITFENIGLVLTQNKEKR